MIAVGTIEQSKIEGRKETSFRAGLGGKGWKGRMGRMGRIGGMG